MGLLLVIAAVLLIYYMLNTENMSK